MRLTLSACPPFSLAAVMGSHGWIRLAPFGTDPDTGGLTRVDLLGLEYVLEMLIQQTEDGVSVELAGPLTRTEQEEVVRRVAWMLALDQDLSAFYALARKEPKLAQIETGARGRILRSPTLFEDTVKTILTTNTAWSGTIRMVEKLVSQFGLPWPADASRHAFPTADRLAETDEATLRTEAKLGYRAPYVLELARSVASGAFDLEGLKDTGIPTTELRNELLSIKGVGQYAAANLLMILGRYDFVPVDSWALKMVSHEWHGGEPVGRAEVEAVFERWGEWKGLAYWFWDWSYFGEAQSV